MNLVTKRRRDTRTHRSALRAAVWPCLLLCACASVVTTDEQRAADEVAERGEALLSAPASAIRPVPAPGVGVVVPPVGSLPPPTTPGPPGSGTPGGGSGTPGGFLGTLPEIGFSPAHGSVLLDNAQITSPWYDSTLGPNGAIEVEGRATHLPAGPINAGTIAVSIDGHPGTVLASGVGPDGGYVRFEGYADAYVDPFWVQRQIVVEIVNTANDRVLARATNLYYDLRREADASPVADPGSIVGMAAHFTASGIGDSEIADRTVSLETPHLSTLPRGGLAAFNAALEAEVVGPAFEGAPAGACFNLDEVDPRFRDLPQYDGILLEAGALLSVYLAWRNGGEEACQSAAAAVSATVPLLGGLLAAGCSALMQDWCVQDVPRTSDFELCVGRIDGEPSDLFIDSVDDVQLAWGASSDGASVTAHAALAGVHGRVNGLLRGLSLRWADRKCESPPEVDVPDSALDATPGAAQAATCPNLRLDAELATTEPDGSAAFLIESAGARDEELRVHARGDAQFTLVDPEISARTGPCSELALWNAADAVVLAFQDDVERALDATWAAGDQHAEALESLMQRLALGTVEDERYTLAARLSDLQSDATSADFAWRTLVEPLSIVGFDKRMYYHPAGPAPFSPDGSDPEDENLAFDLAFTVTTGYLNQVLNAQSDGELLTFEYAPSWQEVEARWGATPSNTGHPADEPPPLDGSVLARLHPAFAELGATRVQIYVRRTLDPLAWMNPDPPPMLDDAQLAVGIGALEVVFAEPETIDPATGKPVPGREWLRAYYNLRETDFVLGLPEHGNVLDVPASLSLSYGTIVSTRLTGCPMMLAGTPNACEAGLAGTISTLLRDLIEPRLLDMLSRLPAPNVWDAGGEAVHPVGSSVLERRQMNQNVTFLIDVEDW